MGKIMEKAPNETDEKGPFFRYERKFFIPILSYHNVKNFIKLHPAGFYGHFPPRYVNNIYFDTIGLKAFHENVSGLSSRQKVRIRWYGEQQGLLETPTLEYKIKNGLVGTKVGYRLNSFKLDKEFSNHTISELLQKSLIPRIVREEFKFLTPVLLNRYSREYYLSSDSRFRLTLDSNLQFHKLSSMNNTLIQAPVCQRGVVIELKYDTEDDMQANKISQSFPFLLTKNSKYVSGIYHLYE
jgi:SPX domain protein involved in polyphosphate accumulation